MEKAETALSIEMEALGSGEVSISTPVLAVEAWEEDALALLRQEGRAILDDVGRESISHPISPNPNIDVEAAKGSPEPQWIDAMEGAAPHEASFDDLDQNRDGVIDRAEWESWEEHRLMPDSPLDNDLIPMHPVRLASGGAGSPQAPPRSSESDHQQARPRSKSR